MSDVVVTCPKAKWQEWIDEGDLPGDEDSGDEYAFWIPYWGPPNITDGERVYIVAHGKLRGYAPLTYLETDGNRLGLIRAGGAVACTIDEPIIGFRGWRYRFWQREDEKPFPDWKTP